MAALLNMSVNASFGSAVGVVKNSIDEWQINIGSNMNIATCSLLSGFQKS